MAKLTAHDFKAEVVSRDGDKLTYRVTGQVTCPTDGYSFTLSPDNEGINPTDEGAVLALDVTAPSGSVAEVITEEQVDKAFTDSSKLERVGINLGEVRTADGQSRISLQVSGD